MTVQWHFCTKLSISRCFNLEEFRDFSDKLTEIRLNYKVSVHLYCENERVLPKLNGPFHNISERFKTFLYLAGATKLQTRGVA